MERQRRLRTWLVNMIDSGKVEGLEWINEEKTLFKIPWKHESRNDWQPSHAQIFTEWARFTGKYVEGRDKADHKMFKTRLRCAFNKAPDIEEVPHLRKYKGVNPYRVYQLLKSDKKIINTSHIADKKIVPQNAKPRVIPEAVAALRSKLNRTSMAGGLAAGGQVLTGGMVPSLVESLHEHQGVVVEEEMEEEDDDDVIQSDVDIDVASDCDESYASSHIKGDYMLKPVNQLYHNNGYTEQQYKHTPYIPQGKLLPERQACEPYEKPHPPLSGLPKSDYHRTQHTDLYKQNQPMKEDMSKTAPYPEQQKDSQSLVLLQSTRYKSTLLKNLHNLQKDGILCDLLLKSGGGQVIPVHANVMCASSRFFKEKVDHWEVGHSGDTMDSCMTIEFAGIPFDVLNSIIQFIYVGEFEVARASLPIVSRAAHEMNLEDLIILCDHVLKALRSSGGIVDTKSGKPVLPQQAPLMGFNSSSPAPQKPEQQSSPMPVHVNHLNNPALPKPRPVPPTQQHHHQATVAPPPSKKQALSKNQDDWHIPMGKGRLAKGGSQAPNNLDVLCQAVDETIRTESQSDSDGDKTPLVIDELQPKAPGRIDDGDSAYSPPPLTIQLPTTHPLSSQSMVVQVPGGESRPANVGLPRVPLNQAPISAPGANQVHVSSGGGSASTAAKALAVQPLIIPLQPDSLTAAPMTVPGTQVPGIMGDSVTLTSRESPGMQGYPASPMSGGRPSRPRRRSSGSRQGLSGRRASSENAASEQEIQTLIQRIKSRVPESDRVSNRAASAGGNIGGVRLERSHSETGTPSSPIVISGPMGGNNETSASTGANINRFAESEPFRVQSISTNPSVSLYQPPTNIEPLTVEVMMSSKDNVVSDLFQCEHCSREFVEKAELLAHKQHCSSSGGNPQHMCEECGKGFNNETALDQHLQWHEGRKELTCKECNKVCKNPLLLRQHEKMHRTGKFRFRCVECSKSFFTQKKLDQHLRDHIKQNKEQQQQQQHKFTGKYQCRFCPCEYDNEQDYMTHLRSHPEFHQSSSIEAAPPLPKVPTFSGLVAQEVNNAFISQREQPLTLAVPSSAHAQTGDDQVKRLVNIMNHFRTHHLDNKVCCKECNAVIDKADTGALGQHVASHEHNNTPLIIDKTQPAAHTSDEHQQQTAHDEDIMVCPVTECQMQFTDHEDLNEHYKEEHPEHAEDLPPSRPATAAPMSPAPPPQQQPLPPPVQHQQQQQQQQYECSCAKCGKSFDSDEVLQHHTCSEPANRGGREEKVCPICDRVFQSKYATYELKRHLCTHTGDKPVPCRHCDKKFKDYSGRSQHEKRIHGRGPLPRGRQKGYKMDRDQLYMSAEQVTDDDVGYEEARKYDPRGHYPSYLSSSYSTTSTMPSYTTSQPAARPPPLMRLTPNAPRDVDPALQRRLSDTDGAVVVPAARRRGVGEEGSDSGEDLSIRTAIRGQLYHTPERYQRTDESRELHAPLPQPVNVVNPAPTTVHYPMMPSPYFSSPRKADYSKPQDMRTAQKRSYDYERERRHSVERPGLESKGLYNPPRDAALPMKAIDYPPPREKMIIQLSETGVPQVTVSTPKHMQERPYHDDKAAKYIPALPKKMVIENPSYIDRSPLPMASPKGGVFNQYPSVSTIDKRRMMSHAPTRPPAPPPSFDMRKTPLVIRSPLELSPPGQHAFNPNQPMAPLVINHPRFFPFPAAGHQPLPPPPQPSHFEASSMLFPQPAPPMTTQQALMAAAASQRK